MSDLLGDNMNNIKTEEIGLRVVRNIIREKWCSNFQELSHQNDDGVDGLIFLKKKNIEIGGVLRVQIKCGVAYRRAINKYSESICLHLGKDYLLKHRERWLRNPIPIILIYVDPTNVNKEDAWWVNLGLDDAYCKSNTGLVLLPKKQKFGPHSKGDFLTASGAKSLPYPTPIVTMHREDISIFTFKDTLKKQARSYYISWSLSSSNERTNELLGEVIVNRNGWRHITRKGRRIERIMQSLQLLPCAKKIITEATRFNRLGKVRYKEKFDYHTSQMSIELVDFIGIRALVNFPHRDRSLVQVVLKRTRILAKKDLSILFNRLWFYSVYEKRVGC